MINLCIPVLNRYDTLEKLIISATNKINSIRPNEIYVYDNGGKIHSELSKEILEKIFSIYAPSENKGVAKAWNWFIRNVPEIRLICNDDIEFYPDTLKELMNNYSETHLTTPNLFKSNAFSCFTISNKIVDRVGYFDENISPNYGYFEDNDYSHRMSKFDIGLNIVESAKINHIGSATLKNYSPIEKNEHHKKFKLAKANYIRKWGGEPGKETK